MPKVCIFSSVHNALDNRVFYREALSLRKAGYDVTLIAIHPCDEIKDGVHILGLPQVPRWQRPLLWIRLFRMAREQFADIYHFHDPELLLVLPWLRLLTGRPTIYDVHEVYPDFIKVKDYMPVWLRYPLAWMASWLEPILARFQSALIFSDDEIAKVFSKLDMPKITLFNYPARAFINDAMISTADNSLRHSWIIHLGGHERNRGVHLMVEAFSQVLRDYSEARLFLIGHFMPSVLEDEVRTHLEDKGISEAVTITGRIPFETIGDYLAKGAVGWVPWQDYPKNQKNIPTKLFEYMAYGLPIVTSDLASTRPFVINGKNGFCVPASDVKAHAQAILHLLNTPGEAKKMGLYGQELVQTKWNWEQEEKKLLGLYSMLIKAR